MVIRFRQFVKNHRKAIILGFVLICIAIFLAPNVTFAQAWYQIITDPVDFFIVSIAWLVYGVAWLGGQLLLGLIVILVWVSSYNGFISEPIVNVGWTIIRDLCNMAFIIALLYMAFNMVFGLKKGGNLLTLIINAGLINFSKVISGLVIDISQVVMLTFVNGFYRVAGGNILEGLGFTKWFTATNLAGAIDRGNTLTPAGSGAASTLTILITILIALIMIYIAVGIILTFIIVLIGRIFKLWGLLITSPVPFVKKILPGIPDVGGGGGNYWGELSKTAASGPILAFWLWLVFTSVRLYQGQFAQEIFGKNPAAERSIAQGGTLSGQAAGFSEAGSISNILGFIIFIGMLMLALQQAQSQASAMQKGLGTVAAKTRGWLHKKTAVKAYNRLIKEPAASKQELWAQGGGIMKYGNKILAPFKTSWAGLTTKEGEERERRMRHARRMGKGWQNTIEGRRIPLWFKRDEETGEISRVKGGKGWRAAFKDLTGKGDEAKKMEKRAAAARSSIVLSRHIQNAEEVQKNLEKNQGYDTMDGKQLREEFNQYRTSRRIPENIEKMIAVANLMSKKGVWGVQDEDAYLAGTMLEGGIGGREHILLSQKIEKDSEESLGKARAQAISPFFTDPITKEVINVKEKGVLVDDGVGGKRTSREQSDILQYVAAKMNELSRSQGATESVRQFGKSILKSPLLNKFLLHKADEQNSDAQGELLKDKALTDRMKDVQMEINGVIRPVWESFNIEDASTMTPQGMAKDYRIQRYHDVLGPFLHDLLNNLEHYKAEIRKQLQEEGKLNGMNENEKERRIVQWMQDKSQLNLTPEAIRALNQHYRVASLDPSAKLFAIDEGVKEKDKDGNEVMRDVPIKTAERKDISKVREVGKKEEKAEKELNQVMQYTNTSRNRAEDYLDEHRVDRAKSDRDSLASVVVDGHHELSKYLKNLERVMEKLAPDLKKELEPLREKAKQDYENGLKTIRLAGTSDDERRKYARQSLFFLNEVLNQLKKLDEDVKMRERANGRGRYTDEDDEGTYQNLYSDDDG